MLVSSQGEGNPANDPSTGFTSYGSLGVYSLTGNFVPGGAAPVLPVLTTSVAAEVTATSATTGGSVTSDGGAAIVQRGVVYSTLENPTLDNGSILLAPGGGPGTYTATISELAPSTTYFVRAFATNSVGTAYGGPISFVTAPSIGDALEVPSLTWTSGGNAPWRGQSIVTLDGEDAAVSGAISDGQESWMETEVTGPGSLSFWWKVSSEVDYDFLEFYINGQLQSGKISGEVNWQQRSFALGIGTQVLRWRYLKDGSVSHGSDAGYVDQVVFAAHSDNADLDSLSLSSGTLSPAFASGTTGFKASVENAVSSITVTPTAAQANATIHVRGNGGDYATVTSGSASGSLPLNVGANIVDVRVTAEDGVTQRIYSVGVTRDQAGATPAQLFAVAMAAAGLTDDDALPTAMPFGDGVPNLLKYAFNMNLAGADAGILAPDTGTAGLPRITSHNVGEGGGHVIRFEFLRRKGAGLVYTPKKSATLLHDSWSTLQSSPEVTPIDEQWERILYEEPYDPAVTPTVFGKLEVFLP